MLVLFVVTTPDMLYKADQCTTGGCVAVVCQWLGGWTAIQYH